MTEHDGVVRKLLNGAPLASQFAQHFRSSSTAILWQLSRELMVFSRQFFRLAKRKSACHTFSRSFARAGMPLPWRAKRPRTVFCVPAKQSFYSWSLVDQFWTIPCIVVNPPEVRKRPVSVSEISPASREA